MLPQSSWKKLSQGTAIITLGIAILAVSGTNKASAANLQTFKISGTFDQKYLSGGNSIYAYNLAGGSFDGTYTVDVDKLPTTRVNFKNWAISLRDSLGVEQTSFYLSDFEFDYTSGSVRQQELLFVYGASPSSDQDLRLFINSDFTGTSVGRPETLVNDGTAFVTVPPYYGIYEQTYNGVAILVTSFKSEPVPEPFTLGGTTVAGAMGWWLKRKQQKTPNTPA